MVNGIRARNPRRLNKRWGSYFRVGSRVRQKTPEEGRKRCKYNNKDDDNRTKTLNDKNHQASSQKSKQLMKWSTVKWINIKYLNINDLDCEARSAKC